ncbi:MAG TPA: META domain-containing protein [Gemmatimonadales bacterium]|jgi:heat shock protein HslJ|nr:META domain-containing protein [Gemmatimonadales bacterium]
MRLSPGLLIFSAIALGACHRSVASSTTPEAKGPALVGTEWTLVELDGQPAGLGAGDKAATLTLVSDANHASGFAGCNRMSGSYELTGAALRFGPMAVTRMACATGMDLETKFLSAIEATRGYRMTDQGLELTGETGTLARFTHP